MIDMPLAQSAHSSRSPPVNVGALTVGAWGSDCADTSAKGARGTPVDQFPGFSGSLVRRGHPHPSALRGRTIPTVAAVAAVTVVTILVAGVGVARSFLEDAFNYHIDFDVYRAGGQAVLDGEPLYRGSSRQHHRPAVHLSPAVGPALRTDRPAAQLGGYIPFALVSALSLVLVTVIVLNALSTERGPAGTNRTMARRTTWTIGWLLLPLAIWMWPITQTLFYGQINILLMLMVVADLLLPRTWWPRGMLIGLAATIKLTPAVFGLYFLVNRQWRRRW